MIFVVSLEMNYKQFIKQKVMSLFMTHENDCGSTSVQVGLLFHKIKLLTEHVKANKKDYSAQRSLKSMVSKYKRLLKYLKDRDMNSYNNAVSLLV